MINNQVREYEIKEPVKTKDKYNQEIADYQVRGTAKVALSLNNHTHYVQNNLFITQCEFIGITDNQDIQIGWLVDKYECKFIVETPRQRFLYLKEYDHNG